MDKDQAVKHLMLKADLLTEHDGNEHVSKNYRAIAALIEQQAEQINKLMQIIESQKETNLAIINKLEKMKCCCNCKYVAVACDSDGCQSKGGFDDWEIRDWEYEDFD